MSHRTNLPRQILEKLFAGSTHSVPELAKSLGQPSSTVELQLQRLVDLDIVKVTEPQFHGGVRHYGKKYYLNPSYAPKTTRTTVLLSCTFALTILGILFLILNPLTTSSLFFLFPSLVGLYYTVNLYRKINIDALNSALSKIPEKRNR